MTPVATRSATTVHEEFCKRVSRIGKNRLLIEPDNKAYPSQEVQWIEDDEYRDVRTKEPLSLYVHGRVVDPPDTGHSINRMMMDSFTQMHKEIILSLR